MYPILIQGFGITLYAFSVALVIAWGVFSFFFWRHLRSLGVEEERIFDLTFYATISALLFSRLFYVLLYPDVFVSSYLKIAAVWVAPGFSLYGAIFGGMLPLLFLSRRNKVRVGYVMDAVGLALPWALIIGTIGALLDGTYVGKVSSLPWAISYLGHEGLRHPVQLYEALMFFVIGCTVVVCSKKALSKSWPYGIVGLWFFLLFSVLLFTVEFVKEGSVYWISLAANQWFAIAIFAETIGALYVRGGLRESMRPAVRRIEVFIHDRLGGIYAKFTRRGAR